MERSLAANCRPVLDAIPDHAAVIDPGANLLEINRAWQKFSAENGGTKRATGQGANYLRVCEKAAKEGFAQAGEFAAGLQSVLHQEASLFQMEYPCHSPTEKRWFCARVEALDGLYLILHRNVTLRTELQQRLVTLQAKLSERERQDQIASWAAFLAHQIKNPLSVIRLRSQLLGRMIGESKGTRESWLESCGAIATGVDRVLKVIESARSALQEEQEEPRLLSIRALLMDAAALSRAPALIIEVPEETFVEGPPVALLYLLTTLLLQLRISHHARVQIGVQERDTNVLIRIEGRGSYGVDREESELNLQVARRLALVLGSELNVEMGTDSCTIFLVLPRRIRHLNAG